MRTLQDQLVKKGLAKPQKKTDKPKKKQEERLTSREWADIMGTNRNTYRRGPGGAYRSK